MTFKRVTSAVSGDATHFGGLDVNKFSDYLGGTDIGGSETVDVATLTAFRDSKFTLRNPANTFSYVFVPSAIVASRNVTLPLLTGNDTLVSEAFAQTLTNKTINASSNTLSNIADSSLSQITNKAKLPSAIVYTDQTNTFGDFAQLIRSGRLALRNPADTFSYLFTGSAIGADRTWTLPLLTGNDTAVAEAHTQTLTNKTVNATNNTITDTSTAAGDILASNGTKFVRKARGSALQVLQTNSGGTDIEWATPSAAGAGTEVAQNPITKRTGSYQPAAGSTLATVGSLYGCLSQHTPTGTGTISNTFDTTEGIIMNFTSAASTGSNAGLLSSSAGVGIGRRLFGLKVVARFSMSSTSTGRVSFGLTSDSVPASSSLPVGTGDNGIMVGWNETGSGSTNWSIFHNDGTGAATVSDITGPIAKDTNWHTVKIEWAAAANPFVTFDGTSQQVTTDLPLTSADLYFYLFTQASTTTAKTISIKGIWIEIDK